MEPEIDYQSIAEKLQHELEQARLEIVRMRFSARSFTLNDAKVLKRFIMENYFVIMTVVFVLLTGISFFDTVKSLFFKETKGDA